MNTVFVLDTRRAPLTPCHPARARALLKQGKAAVFRRMPFTIILKTERPAAVVKPLVVKIHPGSKTTGLALVDGEGRVLFGAELAHRGQAIKGRLESRRTSRRLRRHRKTRYRAARFNNRTRPQGWLPPSLQHRVETTLTWVNRFRQRSHVAGIVVERFKFDTQKMQNPELSGIEYQQGELAGYEVREYLLEKWGRLCAYCGAGNVPLEVEHIVAKACGGSNRVSNLTLACRCCNQKKGQQPVEQFLKRKPERLKRILAKLKVPLRDAAAVNATRHKLFTALQQTGLPVETGTGAQTKFNRTQRKYPKASWIDAACAGDSGAAVTLDPAMKPLSIKATGHGARQTVRMNEYGFPCAKAKSGKKVNGIQTGDLVKIVQTKGKYIGRYVARVSAIKTENQYLSIHLNGKQTWFSSKQATLVQKADGYAYA